MLINGVCGAFVKGGSFVKYATLGGSNVHRGL